jgi:hypothetical protein
VHIERVTRAIALLRWVHAEFLPFDIADWFEEPEETLNCGTAACAVGWMARDPWMQEQGLAIVDAEPVYLGHTRSVGFYAVAAFFDIPHNLAQYVFTRYAYTYHKPTANDIADKMQALIYPGNSNATATGSQCWLDAEQKNRPDTKVPDPQDSLGREAHEKTSRAILEPV